MPEDSNLHTRPRESHVPGKKLLAHCFLDDVGGANGDSWKVKFVQWVVSCLYVYHDGAFGELFPCPLDEHTGC
jgi:hypothetical protein